MEKKRKECRDEACMTGREGSPAKGGCLASGPNGNLSHTPFPHKGSGSPPEERGLDQRSCPF